MKDFMTSAPFAFAAASGSSRGNHYGRLTARELQVLELLAQGLSNKMISRRLGITPATVKCHVGKILGAMGASNRLEAVIVASRLGLLGDALTRRRGAADDSDSAHEQSHLVHRSRR
jgi:DNA-binding NarL/FixJ family response regulator